MSDQNEDLNLLRQEVAYYRKKTDELAGENLKLDYTISGLRHELKQKREGFSLLSLLQGSLGLQQELSGIFSTTINAINSTLGMDKTIVLFPTGTERQFKPGIVLGQGLDEAALKETVLEVPESITKHKETLLVNKATEVMPFHQQIKDIFALPYFVVSSVGTADQVLGVIISGRLREAKPLYPPFDKGDADTFTAIGGLISATMEVMKVATLKETDRLKTEFFANISHEFRTPITLTIGPLEALLHGRYGEINDRVKREIEIILRNQRRLLELINQILDLAKMESGMMQLKFSRLPNLNSFIHDRLEQFQGLAEKRGLELIGKFDEQIATQEIYLDAEKMDKVIFNLISNSVKFTKTGSVTVETKNLGHEFEVSVTDTGIGIKPDQLPHIFDRFRQADGSSSREFAGTGIGLSLVKEVVDLHGGQVVVLSEYGKGTSFKVRIPSGSSHLPADAIIEEAPFVQAASSQNPLVRVEDMREGRATEQDILVVDQMNQATTDNFKSEIPKILYVDDNPDLRKFVHGLLEHDYNVYLAYNGQDGFEKAKSFQVDLVLSDLMMPVMTGSELFAKLRSDPVTSSIPFVMLTAKSGGETKIQELERGADDFLNKPFSERELRARIGNLLKIREQQQRIKQDLRAASNIQMSLLPPLDHQFENSQLQFFYRPCEDLSGDFFEVYRHGSHVYFYVADVTSHGTASAQITYLLKGVFRNMIPRLNGSEKVEELVAEIAKDYIAYNLDYAIAMTFCRYNVQSRICEIINSCGPTPMVMTKEKPKRLESAMNPMIDRETPLVELKFEKVEVQMEAGQSLYVMTDGAFEFTNRERQMFSQSRLGRILHAHQGNDWREKVFAELKKFSGSENFPDDITILRLKA